MAKKMVAFIITAAMLLSTALFAHAAGQNTTQAYLYTTQYTKTANHYTAYKALRNESLQFAIPGLSNGTTGGVGIAAGFFTDYVPQGITFDSHTRKFYVSAYSDSKQNTVIFVLSQTGAYERTLEIENYTGHAGGIACDGKNLYLVSGLSIYYVRLQAVKAALQSEANTVTVAKSRIAVNSELCGVNVGDKDESGNQFASCSFCTYFGGLFWFGEFSLESTGNDYPYRESGESYFFGIDLSEPAAPVLKKVMTVPCKTQGAAFFKDTAGNVYLACSLSYGRNNASTLRFYKPTLSEWGSDSGEGLGVQKATGIGKFVHKNNNIKSMDMPNLMEEVCTFVSGGKLYLMSMYESGAKKYASTASYVMDRVSAIDIGSCLNIAPSTASAAAEHVFVTQNTQEPTCTQAGYTDALCAVCTQSKHTALPALGHDFSATAETDETLAPTFEGEPEYYYSCSRCGMADSTSGRRFLHQTPCIYAKTQGQEQYHSVTVQLLRNGVVLAQKELAKTGTGALVFEHLEHGTYTLHFSGSGLLSAEIRNIRFESGTALEVCQGETLMLCAGDVNADGIIDIADISAVLSADIYTSAAPQADFDENGVVEMEDIACMLLSQNYGKTTTLIEYEERI